MGAAEGKIEENNEDTESLRNIQCHESYSNEFN